MLKSLSLITAFMFLLPILCSSLAYSKETVPTSNTKRSNVPKKFQWKPEHIFKTDADWELAYKEVMQEIPSILKYKGRLSRSYKELAGCLDLLVDLAQKTDRVYSYPQYFNSGNEKNPKWKGMFDRAKMLHTEFLKSTSYIEPEILKIKQSKLKKFMKKDKDLKIWEHYFDALYKRKKHILSDKEESILANAADMMGKPENIFVSFKTNIKFPYIKDETGKRVRLNFTNFTRFRESKKRSVRMANARKFFKTLNDYIDTFAANIDFSVKKNIFIAKTRKYDSALDAALKSNYFTKEVYDKLTSAVYDNLSSSLHKYIEMRKRVMNTRLKKGQKMGYVHFYDLYNPLVPSFDKKYDYKTARNLLAAAFKPLGDDYVEAFKLGSHPKNGWVDIYPNKHKHDGAYASELWGVHPYILLNYQQSLDDVSTFAHEYGHGMHYYFAEKKQPYIYYDPETMGTEVASIFNEMLMLDYLIKRAKSKKEKLYLLNRRLENIRLTFFRQILFSEFERKIHEEVENKKPLTGEKLNKIYSDLIKKFYGPHFAIGKYDGAEWAYIPHFYYNFYVWKYAAGIASAAALSKEVTGGVKGASKKYLDYLQSGSSDFTMNLLKKAGVDLTDKATYTKIIDIFTRTVEEFDKVFFNK